MRQILLQNASAILLQNATEVYYKMRQVFYYKMRQLLQIATILLQNATVITKCDVYYKLRQYILLCQYGLSKDRIFYLFSYNSIHWSSYINKKSSFLSLHSLLFLVNNTGKVKD